MLFFIRSGFSDRPAGEHGNFLIAHLGDRFRYSEVAFADIRNLSAHAERYENFMRNYRRFLHRTQHVAGDYFVADFLFGNETPFLFAVEIVYFKSSRDSVAVIFDDFFERTLNSVEDTLDKSGSEFHGKRHARRNDFVADAQSRSFLVYLNGRFVAAKFDNLAYKFFFSDFYDVVHLYVRHIFSHYKRP